MKVSELEGKKLDFWVAKANGTEIIKTGIRYITRKGGGEWKPSISWALAGPIIEREGISILKELGYQECRAGINPVAKVSFFDDGDGHCDEDSEIEMRHSMWGSTPLIAAMRCYVASKFGDKLDDSQTD